MKSLFKPFVHFFNPQSSNYAHRNRSIEIIAIENNIDIKTIKDETFIILENEGRIQAITYIRHRFHVPLSPAWVFVDLLDKSTTKD